MSERLIDPGRWLAARLRPLDEHENDVARDFERRLLNGDLDADARTVAERELERADLMGGDFDPREEPDDE